MTKILSLTILAFGCFVLPVHAEEIELTPASLREALAASPRGDAAATLADKIRAWFGAENLAKGPAPKVESSSTDKLDVAWAIEIEDVPEAALGQGVIVRSADGAFTLPLTRVGQTHVYAGTTTLADGAAMLWSYEAAGKKISEGKLEVYAPRTDNQEHPGVPKGTLTQQPVLASTVFPGTTRDWWIYVPAQYKPDSPACVMFFQDGGGMKNYVPTTFDNLIAKGEMPVTVGIFINPGAFEDKRSNRSFEYDTLSDQYARFLLDEVLPIVEKGAPALNLRHDAAGRAICGISSGGICSWTAAWERPDQFSKVLSFVGSFTNIASGESLREGGHNYPALIRKTPMKPIRAYLQDGENDLDNVHGNWPLANQMMANSLKFAGYDYQFVYGHGFHSDQHGRAILPDALRWLWRE